LSVFTKFISVAVSVWIGLQYYEGEILDGADLNEAWWRRKADLPAEIPSDIWRDLAIYTLSFNGFLRNGFLLTLLSDVIEGSFRGYLRIMDPVKYRKLSLYWVYRYIIEVLDLPQYEPLCKLFRLMRNCIHNNGLFLPDDGADDVVEYDGRRVNAQLARPARAG
jgi:hypothetical protein